MPALLTLPISHSRLSSRNHELNHFTLATKQLSAGSDFQPLPTWAELETMAWRQDFVYHCKHLEQSRSCIFVVSVAVTLDEMNFKKVRGINIQKIKAKKNPPTRLVITPPSAIATWETLRCWCVFTQFCLQTLFNRLLEYSFEEFYSCISNNFLALKGEEQKDVWK